LPSFSQPVAVDDKFAVLEDNKFEGNVVDGTLSEGKLTDISHMSL